MRVDLNNFKTRLWGQGRASQGHDTYRWRLVCVLEGLIKELSVVFQSLVSLALYISCKVLIPLSYSNLLETKSEASLMFNPVLKTSHAVGFCKL